MKSYVISKILYSIIYMDINNFLNNYFYHLIVGGVLLIIGITVGVVLYFKSRNDKKKEEEEIMKKEQEEIMKKEEQNANTENLKTYPKTTNWGISSENAVCKADGSCVNLQMLDRHDIVCETGVLNSLNLEFDDKSNIRYAYNCINKGISDQRTNKETQYSDNTLAGLEKKTEMICDQNSLITNLRMNYSADMKARNYKYSCAASKTPLSCSSHNTESIDIQKVDSTNLFKNLSDFKIKCPENTGLSEIKFVKENDKYKYNYKCCN